MYLSMMSNMLSKILFFSPFLKGFNLLLISLKSGLSLGLSDQHCFNAQMQHSGRWKIDLFSFIEPNGLKGKTNLILIYVTSMKKEKQI